MSKQQTPTEKLIEATKGLAEYVRDNCDFVYPEMDELLNDCFTALAEAEKAQQADPWIPVTERLPSELVNCWVYLKSGRMDAATLFENDNGGYFFLNEDEEYQIEEVTHWMPLEAPEPPKQ